MKHELRKDLERLQRLAFTKVSGCEEFLHRFHSLKGGLEVQSLKSEPDYELLEKIYGWVFVPLSLWPEDLKGFGMHIIEKAEIAKPESRNRSEGGLDAAGRLMARLLPEAPPQAVCRPIADYEHGVKAGNYEVLIAAQGKFDALERGLRENPELQADWEEIKAIFDVSKYQNAAGVIRRRLVQERNFRPVDWKFSWETEAQRFQNVFDAFCYKWDLYGMERRQTSSLKPQASGKAKSSNFNIQAPAKLQAQNSKRTGAEDRLLNSPSPRPSPSEPDRPSGEGEPLSVPAESEGHQQETTSFEERPLLLKLTVTITPYGTIIMVPKYWSFDPRRDLKWKAIAKLHRTRSAQKQGPKLVSNQAERREEARRAREFWGQATEAGLRGQRREQWVMGRLGWDARTDESRLRRTLKC